MNPNAIIIIILVFTASYFLSRYMKKKNEKFSQKFDDVDFKKEYKNAEKYKVEYLDNNLSFVKNQMTGKVVDAYTFANVEFNNSTMAKDTAKDILKSVATLGTVKYQTVSTPKYLVLSEGNLHLLDTDLDGEICNDLVFNKERLANSKLEEIVLESYQKEFAKKMGENIKGYKISLATDDKPIELILFSALICTAPNFYSTSNFETSIKEIVIANNFLEQIGNLYPNMKIRVPILNS